MMTLDLISLVDNRLAGDENELLEEIKWQHSAGAIGGECTALLPLVPRAAAIQPRGLGARGGGRGEGAPLALRGSELRARTLAAGERCSSTRLHTDCTHQLK